MRFNLFSRNRARVRNHEGAKAFGLTSETELYSAVVTAGLSDSFYEEGGTRITRIQQLIPEVSAEYVAKLAVYTRTQMHLRSVPMVLAVELAKANSGNDIVRKTVRGVVKRADEITELLALYQLANSRTGKKRLNGLSKQVQKGLADAFNSFDEYQFAKYNRAGEIKLRDALFVVHPIAKDEVQQTIFNKIAAGKLSIPYTWETELSELGKRTFGSYEAKRAAKRAKWQELIDSDKTGYMALLRNLRNILVADVSGRHMERVCARIADADAVATSKQLPFRFFTAYREVQGAASGHAPAVLAALEDAVRASVANLSGFNADTSVLIACDVSGSMYCPISAGSKVMYTDIGLVLGMLAQHKCRKVITGLFGDIWKQIPMPAGNILNNVQRLRSRAPEVGYATNGYRVIDDLIKRGTVIDRVMIFTDCQLWDSSGWGNSISRSWKKYKQIAPDASLYLFDLAGNGRVPLSVERHDVFLIAGWSDKVFDVLDAIENGGDVTEKINSIEL